PPLHHGVLHARPERVALCVTPGHWHGEVVDDMQHRHDHYEGHEIPVGDVDVRFLPPRQGAGVEHQVSDPHDHEPEVGVPFGLGIFLRLRDADEIAAYGKEAEQIVAHQHEPGAELAGQPGSGSALHNMKGGGNKRVAAEPEYDAGCMGWPHAPESGPGGVEGEVRPCELRGYPHAHEHAEDSPDHGQHDPDLDRVVVVVGLPVFRWFGLVDRRQHESEQDATVKQHYHALHAQRIGLA